MNDLNRLQRINTDLHEEIAELKLEISLLKLQHAAELLQAAHDLNKAQGFTPSAPTGEYLVQVPVTRISKALCNSLPVNISASTNRYVHLHPINRETLQSLLDRYIPCKVTQIFSCHS